MKKVVLIKTQDNHKSKTPQKPNLDTTKTHPGSGNSGVFCGFYGRQDGFEISEIYVPTGSGGQYRPRRIFSSYEEPLEKVSRDRLPKRKNVSKEVPIYSTSDTEEVLEETDND